MHYIKKKVHINEKWNDMYRVRHILFIIYIQLTFYFIIITLNVIIINMYIFIFMYILHIYNKINKNIYSFIIIYYINIIYYLFYSKRQTQLIFLYHHMLIIK
jgi:hypothetical protein